MRFRLFLSHSTAQPDRTRLARIAQDIETQSDGKMKVLWDGGQISGGDDWRARIVDLLHACDGAAILLDEPALDSKWVLAESTFLLLARCRDKDFLTVPVRLAPAEVVQRRLGDPDWAPVPLLHKQMVPATFDDLAVTVVKAFEEAAARGPGHSPIEMLADQISRHLEQAPPQALRALAERLGDEVPYGNQADHVRAALVLARAMIRAPDLVRARDMLRPFGPSFDSQYAEPILERLKSLPIEPHSAATLLAGLPEGSGHSLLQTGKASFTVRLYLDCAYLPDTPVKVLMLQALHANLATLRQEIIREARGTLYLRFEKMLGRSMTETEVEEHLRRMPLYVCTPPIDADVIAELSGLFPRMGFILHHPQHEECVPPAGVRRILPPLDAERENQIYDDYVQAMASI